MPSRGNSHNRAEYSNQVSQSRNSPISHLGESHLHAVKQENENMACRVIHMKRTRGGGMGAVF